MSMLKLEINNDGSLHLHYQPQDVTSELTHTNDLATDVLALTTRYVTSIKKDRLLRGASERCIATEANNNSGIPRQCVLQERTHAEEEKENGGEGRENERGEEKENGGGEGERKLVEGKEGELREQVQGGNLDKEEAVVIGEGARTPLAEVGKEEDVDSVAASRVENLSVKLAQIDSRLTLLLERNSGRVAAGEIPAAPSTCENCRGAEWPALTQEVDSFLSISLPTAVDLYVMFVVKTGRRTWKAVIACIASGRVEIFHRSQASWGTKRKSPIAMDEMLDREIEMYNPRLTHPLVLLTDETVATLCTGLTLEQAWRGCHVVRSDCLLQMFTSIFAAKIID